MNLSDLTALIRQTFAVLIVGGLLLPLAAIAQKRGPSEAAQRGYGTVYASAGRSAPAQHLQARMDQTLQSAILRARKARAGTSKPKPKRNPGFGNFGGLKSASAVSTTSRNYAYFVPDARLDTFSSVANTLGETSEQKEYLKQLFSATRIAFETEVAAKDRKNNLAAAITFFTAAAVTVYHDDPEPSDQALDELWDAMNAIIDETPEYANLPNRDKQEMYDTLVAFGGLLLAGYMEGKRTNDVETVGLYRQLAGVMIELVLKTKPESVRFGKEGLALGAGLSR